MLMHQQNMLQVRRFPPPPGLCLLQTLSCCTSDSSLALNVPLPLPLPAA
jgi:hypothetical protein